MSESRSPSMNGSPGCPACGDAAWDPELGCAACGHGRKTFLAGRPHLLYVLVFIAAAGLGLGAVAAFGVIGSSGPIVNLAFVLGGAALVTFAVHALRKPTSLGIADNAGIDAFGKQAWGSSTDATAEQGVMAGAISLLVGLALIVIGVIAGSF